MTNQIIKVAITGTRGLGNYGGFETINMYLAKKISKRFHIDFYVPKNLGDNLVFRENISIKCADNKHYFQKESFQNIEEEVKTINKLLKYGNKFGIDIIYQCGSTPGLFIKRKNKKVKKPLLLWNPDGLEWKRAKFPWYGKLYLYLATKRGIEISDAIIVDSKKIANSLGKWLENKYVYYVPGGTEILKEEDVNENFIKEFDVEPYKYYILVGRAVPENHILEIIEYFREIDIKKKLVVITNLGNDNYSLEILKAIEKGGKRIVYKGPVYDRNILNSLRYFSFGYIHGHSVGGTNPSLLEALGAGNVSICYDVPFNVEVAKESAFYFRDFKDFKNAIKELENNYKLWEQKKQIALDIAEKNYKWDYVVELHEIVFFHILTAYGYISKRNYLEFLHSRRFKKRYIERQFENFEEGILR